MSRKRIIVADVQRMFADALAEVLSESHDVVGLANDSQTLVKSAPGLDPDVVILEIELPDLGGIEAARKLSVTLPDASFIFLTSNDDPHIAAHALGMVKGASFLLKIGPADELLLAVEHAGRGQTYITPSIARSVLESIRSAQPFRELTERQRQVLGLLVRGKSMKEIAATLGITPRTVAYHKYTMMRALGVETNAELIRYTSKIRLD